MKQARSSNWALSILAAAVVLTGCATSRPQGCAAGEKPMRTARFYVLRPGHGRGLSDAAVRKFLDDEVSPNFPDGLTTVRGGHAWLGRDALLMRASVEVVQIVVPEGAQGDARIARVRAAYRARFGEDPVLHLSPPACMAF